jgi:hypothetical protein
MYVLNGNFMLIFKKDDPVARKRLMGRSYRIIERERGSTSVPWRRRWFVTGLEPKETRHYDVVWILLA